MSVFWLFPIFVLLLILILRYCHKKGWIISLVKKFSSWLFYFGIFSTVVCPIFVTFLGLPQHVRADFYEGLPEWAQQQLGDQAVMSWFFYLAAFFVISGAFINWLSSWQFSLDNKRLEKCVEDLERDGSEKLIDTYNLFSRFIEDYYYRLGLTVNERVSLYKVDGQNFSCVGRFSLDEYFKRIPDKMYPLESGCLWEAYRLNKVQEVVPHDPEEDYERYVDYQVERFSYTGEAVRNIRMKSRSYFALRIKKEQRDAVGVIVFESTQGGLNLQAQHYWSAGDPGTDFWRTSAYTSRGVLAFNVSLGLVLSESAISSSSSWV